MSTNHGIAQLDTQTMTFTNYTKEDGLPNNQFYWNASYYSPQNNLLYFGTINGLVAFTPDIAKTKKQDAKVKLTSISVAGTMVYPPADGKTPYAVTNLHTIRLHEKIMVFHRVFHLKLWKL